MQDAEIQRRIADFPRWHYRLDLRGHTTPIFREEWANRHAQRKRYFFDPMVELLGGSLSGKRVLDIGCNAGFWALLAAQAGCEYVLGIDGRQMHVDQSEFVFEVNEVEKSRYDFITGDVFKTDLAEFGTFDIVLCLGLMYHISKHMDLMEIIDSVNTDLLVIDTSLSTAPGSFLELRRERSEGLDEPRGAVDHPLVMWPTQGAVRDLAEHFGYSVAMLRPRFRAIGDELPWVGARDYRLGMRRAFLCAKETELSGLNEEPTG